MKETTDITLRAAELHALLQAKLGVKGRSLEQALKRAEHHLPRRLRHEGAAIVAAQKMAQNPKLARRMDVAALKRAHDDLSAHLRQIDVADRRKGQVLSLAGSVAFNLLVVSVGFLVWLVWRGYV